MYHHNNIKDVSGNLLVARPHSKLNEIFYKSVIYVVSNDDENGGVGIIINRPVRKTTLSQIISTTIPSESNVELSVYFGGHNNPERGVVIYKAKSQDSNEDTDKKIESEHTIFSNSINVVAEVAKNLNKHYLFAIGCVKWEPGQLAQELNDDLWILVKGNDSVIFDTLDELKWDEALRSASIDPIAFAMQRGYA